MGIGTDLRNFWNAKNEWHEQMWEGIEDDPWRLLTGFDPASTEISNFLLNRDDEPLGDWFGGPTSEQMRTGRYRPEEKSAANKGKVIIPAVVGTVLTAGALGGAAGAGEAGAAGGAGGAAGGAAGGSGGGAAAGGAGGSSGGWLSGLSNGQKMALAMNMGNMMGGGQQQQAQQTPQHVFNQQQLAPLMAPQNEQEAQARNNAMSLLLQQHRG